jgi:hypothetical protein
MQLILPDLISSILPSDLATYGEDAKKLLNKLQTRNERLFMLTFLVLNVADTKQKLGNDVFQAAGVAQKYNCSLVRLDYQQEQGLVSSLPLGILLLFQGQGYAGCRESLRQAGTKTATVSRHLRGHPQLR